jgi:hypothetical protein
MLKLLLKHNIIMQYLLSDVVYVHSLKFGLLLLCRSFLKFLRLNRHTIFIYSHVHYLYPCTGKLQGSEYNEVLNIL